MVKYNAWIINAAWMLWILSGCSISKNSRTAQIVDPTVVKRHIDAEYSTAFNACAHALFTLGYRMRQYDRQKGILVGAKNSGTVDKRASRDALFQHAGGNGEALVMEKIHLRLVRTDKADATAVYFQVIVNGKPEIQYSIVESFWIVAQKEAVLEKGGRAPASYEPDYRAMRNMALSRVNS